MLHEYEYCTLTGVCEIRGETAAPLASNRTRVLSHEHEYVSYEYLDSWSAITVRALLVLMVGQ